MKVKPNGKGSAEAFEIKPQSAQKKKQKAPKEHPVKKKESEDSALLSDVTSVLSSSISEESHRIMMESPDE